MTRLLLKNSSNRHKYHFQWSQPVREILVKFLVQPSPEIVKLKKVKLLKFRPKEISEVIIRVRKYQFLS